MNCRVLTMSGGSKNGKRNYSAANRGARAEQHRNSSIDFLKYSSRCRKRNGRPNAEALTSLCQFLAAHANVGDGTVVRTKVVLAQCFSCRGLRQRLSLQHGWREPDRCPRTINSC